MVKLRPYQEDALEKIWSDLFKKRTVLAVLPCGSGKTELFMELLNRAIKLKPSFKAVVLLRKINLLEQTERRLKKFFPEIKIGVYSGTKQRKELDSQITVSTIQSIYKVVMPDLNCIILDEAHNVDEKTGQYFNFISNHGESKIIGFTATPFRSSGYIYGKDKLFESVSYNKPLGEMISEGFLVPPRMKKTEHQYDVKSLKIRMGDYKQEDVERLTSDKKKIDDQIKDALSRMGGRTKVVWACSSIRHCEDVAAGIQSNGERALYIHSEMSAFERDWAVNLFERGDVRHLVFVSIISEGFDYPPIDCIVLMRPTRSPVLYIQTVGRGLRLSENKKDCLVLDYGRVIETLGPIDDPQVRTGRKSDFNQIRIKICVECFEYVSLSCKRCPVCHYEFYTLENKRDSLKNLTHKASGDFGILKSKPVDHVIEIESVELSKYVSKNGNECLVVGYTTKDISNRFIKQYYVWDNEWARKKINKLLLSFDCEFKPTLEEQVLVKVNRVPFSITYAIENKYPTVKGMVFI